MFYVHKGVWLDPTESDPQIYIETKGLVVEKHNILLPAQANTARWQVDGTNIPSGSNDLGTPDIYVIPEFRQQGRNLLEIFVNLFNVTSVKRKYSLKVEIHQADYEPDILFDESGELGTTKGTRTEVYGVFVPLRIMT